MMNKGNRFGEVTGSNRLFRVFGNIALVRAFVRKTGYYRLPVTFKIFISYPGKVVLDGKNLVKADSEKALDLPVIAYAITGKSRETQRFLGMFWPEALLRVLPTRVERKAQI